jgi:valyl-tRNA synthetase
MSKSYDNVIDPIILMDEVGTDALRFSMLVGSTPGKDMNVSTKQVEPSRNFINKIWNASRFIISNLEKIDAEPKEKQDWTLADSWIWARVQSLVRDVERLFQSYQYGEAGRQIYEFFWSEFADWYLEVAKLQLSEGGERASQTASTLARVLNLSMRLLHPFIPYITEEIWGNLRNAVLESPLVKLAADWPEALIVASWPEPRKVEGWESECIADFALVQEAIRSIRNLRSEKNIRPGLRIPALLTAGDKTDIFREQRNVISALAQLDTARFEITSHMPPKDENQVVIAFGPVEIYLPLEGMVDTAEERERLNKALTEAQSQAERLEKLLTSSFAVRAPAEIVQKERDKLAGYHETVDKLRKQLASLG